MSSVGTLEDGMLLRALSAGVVPAGDRIAEALRRAVTLRIFEHERLPPERELADLLGVSRITVRQALKQLRAEGRVRSVSGRGGGTYQMLIPASSARTKRPDVALAELMEVIEFRGLIEPLASRLAARRVTRRLVDRLGDSISEMAASRSLEGFRHSDSVFHLLIAEATGNHRLLQTILAARADFLLLRDRLPVPFVPGHNVEEHLAILDALKMKDADAAEQAMAAHLNATKRDFKREIGRTRPTRKRANADLNTTQAAPRRRARV